MRSGSRQSACETSGRQDLVILLQVGGRLGGIFDEDPRRWRMLAVGFASLGLAFEIATTAFPANFILLAGLGNFAKALGKGLSQPSFRIIQTHFAPVNNVGEVSAKEEVRHPIWFPYCGFHVASLFTTHIQHILADRL